MVAKTLAVVFAAIIGGGILAWIGTILWNTFMETTHGTGYDQYIPDDVKNTSSMLVWALPIIFIIIIIVWAVVYQQRKSVEGAYYAYP